MKIAYQNKNCWKLQAGNWEDCEGCVFQMDTFGEWPCDLIPGMKCAGLDIYFQANELEEIFKV
jgi:hypothetical protein